MGVAVTIADGSDGVGSFSFFLSCCQTKSRPKERSDRGPFSIGNCESCTRPISRNSGSMEAREYGLTRWTCLLARHLEVVAVAGLL